MANRILRWIVYTILFALLPTLISLLFSILFNVNVNNYSTELLFFIIMVCATSLNDIQETKQIIKKDFIFNLFFAVCIVMIVIVSVIYGGSIILTKMFVLTNEIIEISNKIEILSIRLSILNGIMGLIIQIILFKVEVAYNELN